MVFAKLEGWVMPMMFCRSLNKPVSSLTSNAIMLLSMGYVRKAYEIIKEMEEVGMKPDSVTCNTLIAYFCKSGDLALALRVMKRMIKDGLVPTTATYRALLHACCLNGKTKGAMKLFTDMSSISMIPPNTITYNILIESLCKNNEVKVALSLMEDIQANGVKPDTTTYNALFKGMKEKNMLEDGLIQMDSKIQHACHPDSINMQIPSEWLSAVGELEKLKSFVQRNKLSEPTEPAIISIIGSERLHQLSLEQPRGDLHTPMDVAVQVLVPLDVSSLLI
ncbi:hypothetical protein Golax_013909 [Gossypium laxum]|uniref:Pentatricopeptide repeat-containing protein n=1 Tax=Gossypium laxum TaxID=34288 RepID=A0A7J8ZT21_9ROSI|nr:hypothetical protein [Gossypium laxum]